MDGKDKITGPWKWDNATKITLTTVFVGIFFGIVFTLLMKYLKGNL